MVTPIVATVAGAVSPALRRAGAGTGLVVANTGTMVARPYVGRGSANAAVVPAAPAQAMNLAAGPRAVEDVSQMLLAFIAFSASTAVIWTIC